METKPKSWMKINCSKHLEEFKSKFSGFIDFVTSPPLSLKPLHLVKATLFGKN